MERKTFCLSAYTAPRYTLLGYDVPVTITYNACNDVNGNVLVISNVYEKKGIVYADYKNGKEDVLYINANIKYTMEDGSEFGSQYSIPCTYGEKGYFEIFDISRVARMKRVIKKAFACIDVRAEKVNMIHSHEGEMRDG